MICPVSYFYLALFGLHPFAFELHTWAEILIFSDFCGQSPFFFSNFLKVFFRNKLLYYTPNNKKKIVQQYTVLDRADSFFGSIWQCSILINIAYRTKNFNWSNSKQCIIMDIISHNSQYNELLHKKAQKIRRNVAIRTKIVLILMFWPKIILIQSIYISLLKVLFTIQRQF